MSQSNQSTEEPRSSLAGELVVPAMMLACVAIYWTEAKGLSAEAKAFPFALTVVVILTAVIVVVSSLLSFKRAAAERMEPQRSETSISLTLKTWSIVLLPVPLIFVWRDIGAVPALFLYAWMVLLLLGERRKLWLVLLPVALSFGLFFLFRSILYVRLPDIPWLLGG